MDIQSIGKMDNNEFNKVFDYYKNKYNIGMAVEQYNPNGELKPYKFDEDLTSECTKVYQYKGFLTHEELDDRHKKNQDIFSKKSIINENIIQQDKQKIETFIPQQINETKLTNKRNDINIEKMSKAEFIEKSNNISINKIKEKNKKYQDKSYNYIMKDPKVPSNLLESINRGAFLQYDRDINFYLNQ